MAVTKIWPVRKQLEQVVAYVENGEKTVQREFCTGIHCDPDFVLKEFLIVKNQFFKQDGILAYHGYISFLEEDIPPELAHRVGREFTERVWGSRYQALVATHLNTPHPHCHFIINSVSFVDGKKLTNNEINWFRFRHDADLICKKYGLFCSPCRTTRSYMPKVYYDMEKAGLPTPNNAARAALDEAVRLSGNERDMCRLLKQMDYTLVCDSQGEYRYLMMKGEDKPVRVFLLGEEYTRKRIRERLVENRHHLRTGAYPRKYPGCVRKKQYRLPTRLDRAREAGGLRGLYLCYCCELGILPRYRKIDPIRVSGYLRGDLIRLEQLTAQTALLCREGITAEGELEEYRQAAEEKKRFLTAGREALRRRVHQKGLPAEQVQEARTRISGITQQLARIRRELRLCDGIAEQSGLLQKKLEQAEEAREKGKEGRSNEYRR